MEVYLQICHVNGWLHQHMHRVDYVHNYIYARCRLQLELVYSYIVFWVRDPTLKVLGSSLKHTIAAVL